jgi:general L-amino acid transport system permease protein
MVEPTTFVRREMIAAVPPPRMAAGPLLWLRQRLFATVLNSILTIISVVVLAALLWPALRFLLIDAVWSGTSRDACVVPGRPVGACWPFIAAKFTQFIYGGYPAEEQWRVDLTYVIGVVLLVPLLIPRAPYKIANAFLFFIVYPILAGVFLVGGNFKFPWFGLAVDSGLDLVETRLWGGLLVTLVISFVGIIGSLPLGILLALGRRSDLPIVRMLSVTFIEFWRGVPLITVLFFATYMLPFFLPESWKIDPLARVLIGVVLFAGAYMAEVVRGGLQAIGRGQFEGAMALGLGYWRTMGLIVLPQALKHVIPGIVNSFIALFKDTTLVLIVSIFDLLGQLRAGFADQNWITPATVFTGFAFAGIIYFAISFAMSRYALYTEQRLAVPR